MDRLSNIANFADVVSAVAMVILTYIVFRWTRRVEANAQARHTNNDWQTYNYSVLSDPDRLAIEIQNHPFGAVTEAEMKKVYHYFTLLNIANSSLRSRSHGFLGDSFAKPLLLNLARQTFNDRDFIEKHVLPRGYDDKFCDIIRSLWLEIEMGKLPRS